jgi:hypothetical protein
MMIEPSRRTTTPAIPATDARNRRARALVTLSASRQTNSPSATPNIPVRVRVRTRMIKPGPAMSAALRPSRF